MNFELDFNAKILGSMGLLIMRASIIKIYNYNTIEVLTFIVILTSGVSFIEYTNTPWYVGVFSVIRPKPPFNTL